MVHLNPREKEKNANLVIDIVMKSTYGCMFGIFKGVNKLATTDSGRCCHHDRHYLLQEGTDDKTYWAAFVKNKKKFQRHEIPRYMAEDKERVASELRGDRLMPNLTFADLYDNQLFAMLAPLEEFVLRRWYHGRMVLMGDSVHKVLLQLAALVHRASTD